MTRLFIDYKTLEEDTLLLAKKIEESLPKDIQIVCISRGGLFIGGLLSYALNKREVYCVGIESYKSNNLNDNKEIQSRTPFLPKIDKTKKYLFIDDLNDSSQTYSFVANKSKELGISFYFATTYHKLRNDNMKPDFVGRDLPPDCWVVFPWDHLEKESNEA